MCSIVHVYVYNYVHCTSVCVELMSAHKGMYVHINLMDMLTSVPGLKLTHQHLHSVAIVLNTQYNNMFFPFP